MSTAQDSLLPLPSSWNRSPSVQTPHAANDSGRIIFTRQLWQRTMPDEVQGDPSVLNRSHSQDTPAAHNIAAGSSRRTSSVSSQSQRNSPTGSQGTKAPLTPEESPPFRTTRKRNTGIVEQEDQDLDRVQVGQTHSRANSDDSIHVCICQPDPKIPRPRNAFILYRQHHQANVISQHPGLSNPEISKIIGEQWQNQSPEVKGKWKALAEEEKLRHQAQYPTYRYQPKRTGRRNSLSVDGVSSATEKAKCNKCGGKTILAPSTPYSHMHSASTSPAGPHTPGSALTPISRTLPVLRDLSLQSPALRRTARPFPNGSMSPSHHLDDRDEMGPLSPDAKRRRFNEQPATFSRVMAPRYANAPQQVVSVGPGTPFPFTQQPSHPYPPGAGGPHVRRESLPGLRGMASPPGAMAPPPRPIMGYQQHRLSQGHIPHDRSLTLPPLQTNSGGGGPPSATTTTATATPATAKSAADQIMNMEFWHKVKVLHQVAPPTPVSKAALRGPFVAIEGDNLESVKELGVWLSETLAKGDDLSVKLLDGPTMTAGGGKQKIMAQYHRLAAEWLDKSADIIDSLAINVASPTDTLMVDATAVTKPANKSREIDEKYDDSDSASSKAANEPTANSGATDRATSHDSSKMDLDATSKSSSLSSRGGSSSSAKPVSIIANYSLHASNFFACHIPTTSHDPYSPIDHWTWTATQWRGIISPDLTIYVRDAASNESGKSNVEIMADGNLFAVKRTKAEGRDSLEIEPSVLRRLGFEVGEWVQAFGANASQ